MPKKVILITGEQGTGKTQLSNQIRDSICIEIDNTNHLKVLDQIQETIAVGYANIILTKQDSFPDNGLKASLREWALKNKYQFYSLTITN